MSRSGGQSEATPPVFKYPSKFGILLSSHCSKDKILSRNLPYPGIELGPLMSHGSAFSILITVYLSGVTEDIARRQQAFYIGIGALHAWHCPIIEPAKRSIQKVMQDHMLRVVRYTWFSILALVCMGKTVLNVFGHGLLRDRPAKANMVVEVWHRLEAAFWTPVPSSTPCLTRKGLF
ncbi:hypothetical protein TNCV_3929201 [Trichonephila clavipes]|nr:hypothetical protein TNCV_3929201 [Trichonephila clavipes]